jgi:voltage-gated potassium channel
LRFAADTFEEGSGTGSRSGRGGAVALCATGSGAILSEEMAGLTKPSLAKTLLTLGLLRERLVRVGPLFLVVFIIVTAAVYFLEKDAPETNVSSIGDAVWFTIVTLSTVGYGDIYPVTTAGRWLTGGFILFTLTAIGFLLTAISETVIEVKQMEENGLIGTKMTGHVVVVGYGPVARTAVEELLAAGRQVALVCERADEIQEARRHGKRDILFVTSGDIDQEILVDRLNAPAAETAVIATEDDTKNIIASLNMQAVNATMRIIVAVKTEALRKTLIASGVTYVASPFELSGRLVASAAFEPEVAKFVEDVTSGVDEGFDLHQYGADPFDGQKVKEVRKQLEETDGPLLVAVARYKDGSFEMLPHPSSELVLDARDQVIVLANAKQAARMASAFGVEQGR